MVSNVPSSSSTLAAPGEKIEMPFSSRISDSSSTSSSSSSSRSLADLAQNDPSLRPSILKELLQNLSFSTTSSSSHSTNINQELHNLLWYDDNDVEEEEEDDLVVSSDDDDESHNTMEDTSTTTTNVRGGGGESSSPSAIVRNNDQDKEDRQDIDVATSSLPPPPPPPPQRLHSTSSNNSNNTIHQKVQAVKKAQRSPVPGQLYYSSRRSPSPHFLSRKQMNVVTSPSSDAAATVTTARRHVRFHTPSNIVVVVPNRDEIDVTTKRALWTDAKELQDQVYRNKMEYLAEGSDPRHVLEDDEFYRDVHTGEKIHPYWIEQATAAAGAKDDEEYGTAVDDYDDW